MYVSKEKAKQIIDEAPGMIWIDSFNGMTFINKANTVDYQNNDFFGLLSLEGVQEFMVHNIKFPQIES